MRDLILRLVVQAITDNARAGLQQVRGWLTQLQATGGQVSAYLLPLFATLWTQVAALGIRSTIGIVAAYYTMAAGVSSAMIGINAAIVSRFPVAHAMLSSVALSARSVVVSAFGAMAAGVSSAMTGIVTIVSGSAAAIDTSIVGIAAVARTAAMGVVSAFSGMAAMLTPIIAQIKGLILPIIGIMGAMKVIKVDSDFEQMEIRIRGMFNGIKESSEKALLWIKQFALQTVYTVRQTTDAFAMMKGFGLDPMDGSLKKVGDAAAKWGADLGAFTGIIRQLGQAWSKSKLQLVDMNIMIDNGLPVINLLSDALGKSSSEILDMSEKGELGRESIRKLIDEMGRQSAGQMLERMKSLSGAVGMMGDAFDNAIDNLRKKGGFDWLTQSVNDVTAAIPDMAATVAQMGGAVGDVFGALWQSVTLSINGILSIINAAFGRSGQSVTVLQLFIGTLKDIQVLIIGFRTSFELLFIAIKGGLANLTASLTTFGEVAKKVFSFDFSGATDAWNNGVGVIDDASKTEFFNAAQKGKDEINTIIHGGMAEPKIPDNPIKPLDAGENRQTAGERADIKALAKAELDAQLSAIKTKQDALTNAHDLELKQLETAFKAKELTLKEQGLNEIELAQKTLALTKDLETAKLATQKDFILKSAELDKAALDAKIQAEKDKLAALPTSTSGTLAALISKGESQGDYNNYNRGTANGAILPKTSTLRR